MVWWCWWKIYTFSKVKEFPIKGWVLRGPTNFTYRISFVILFSNIHYTNWILWEYKKSVVGKFSQLQNYQILLQSVNIWPSNHKNKKGEIFETQCICNLTNSVLYHYYCNFTVFVLHRRSAMHTMLFDQVEYIVRCTIVVTRSRGRYDTLWSVLGT